MKRSTILLAVLLTARSLLRAQELGPGEVVFNNLVAGDVEAPVKRPDGSGAGPTATAQLILMTPDGELKPLTPTTSFRAGSPEAAYFVEQKVVFVGLVQPRETVTLRMRAWDGSSFETATFRGESSDFTVTFGEFPGLEPPRNLSGLAGFTLMPQLAMAAPRLEEGQFRFEVRTTKPRVVIQASEDLILWEEVSSFPGGGAPIQFSDEITKPQRFYRVLAE